MNGFLPHPGLEYWCRVHHSSNGMGTIPMLLPFDEIISASPLPRSAPKPGRVAALRAVCPQQESGEQEPPKGMGGPAWRA